MDSSKQKKLLDLIASDARFREEELAVMLGESVDEIKKTIAELEEKHVICGYHTLIDRYVKLLSRIVRNLFNK